MNTVIKKIAIFFLVLASFSSFATEFPLRAKYPKVPVISVGELEKSLDKVVVVDVRSTLEYETLRIKGATHISLSVGRAFKTAIADLRTSTTKTIVFYCNGITCAKSYKATKVAMANGIANVKAFDLGVMGWANKNPDKSVLLGKSPIDKSKLIPKSEFKKKFLNAADFKAKVGSSVLVDIRNKYQKKGATNLFGGKSMSLNLDNAKNELKGIKAKGKPVLVYDAVGKQVRWLQYAMEEAGIKEYYFLKGGAKGLK